MARFIPDRTTPTSPWAHIWTEYEKPEPVTVEAIQFLQEKLLAHPVKGFEVGQIWTDEMTGYAKTKVREEAPPTKIPDDIEGLPLSSGVGSVHTPCAMSKLSLLVASRYGFLNPSTVDIVFGDSPCWADPWVRAMVIAVNDGIDYSDRDAFAALDGLLDRVFELGRIYDDKAATRVHARAAISLLEAHLGSDFAASAEITMAADLLKAWLEDPGMTRELARQRSRLLKFADVSWAVPDEVGTAIALLSVEHRGNGNWAFIPTFVAYESTEIEHHREGQRLVDALESYLDFVAKARADEGLATCTDHLDAIRQFEAELKERVGE